MKLLKHIIERIEKFKQELEHHNNMDWFEDRRLWLEENKYEL